MSTELDIKLLPAKLALQIEALCLKYPKQRRQSAAVPALWLAQKSNGGWLSPLLLQSVADLLGMPLIRMYEIASFYSMFNLRPVGRYFVQICGTVPCALRGADRLKGVCQRRIGPQGEVSADGMLSWAEVECLGACVDAPVVQLNDIYYEHMDQESLGELLNDPEGWKPPRRERGARDTLSDTSLYDGSRAVFLRAVPGAPETES